MNGRNVHMFIKPQGTRLDLRKLGDFDWSVVQMEFYPDLVFECFLKRNLAPGELEFEPMAKGKLNSEPN
eukprot:918161-Amorphochlora_amoeboformis.AAC.1